MFRLCPHEIHSSKLDYIGLVLAVSGFCNEFSAKNQVEVRFSTQDVPGTLSKDASLCIFRIVQEALRNGVKHSGATCFEVSLLGERGGIELKVSTVASVLIPSRLRRNVAWDSSVSRNA